VKKLPSYFIAFLREKAPLLNNEITRRTQRNRLLIVSRHFKQAIKENLKITKSDQELLRTGFFMCRVFVRAAHHCKMNECDYLFIALFADLDIFTICCPIYVVSNDIFVVCFDS
jgi:hypothetical protein